MATVDHERVLQDMEAHLLTRGSHGQKDLLRLLAELRVKHTLAEGLVERVLRVFGVQIGWRIREAVGGPADADPAGADAMDPDADHRLAGATR